MTLSDSRRPWPGPSAERACVVSTLIAALAIRWAYAAWAYCSTFDSATVGLMAVNILRNGEKPLFFYGQNYFGSLEAWLAAGLFAILGISEMALAMAAILPSLIWIAATWLLFRQWRGPAAGCAAAWTLAVPGWIILHYSTGTYGGYPIAFALGTLVLWLAMRVWDLDVDGSALMRHAAPMATAAGLALWTHFISAAWLLPAFVLTAAHVARRKFQWAVVWPFAASAPLLLATASPLVCGVDPAVVSPGVARWHPAPRVITSNLVGLFGRPLRQHLFVEGLPPAGRWIPLGLCAASFVLCGIAIARSAGRERWRLSLPWACCALFLALYLPHSMAALHVSRYTIPLWSLALAALVAIPVSAPALRLRAAGIGVAAGWILYHGLAGAWAIRAARPERALRMEERESLVAAAAAAGVRSAVIVGSDQAGHDGQMYSFTARGQIAFVNAYGERHRPSGELAERDDRCAWVVHHRQVQVVAAALRDLGATWQETRGSRHVLFHDIHVGAPGGEGILPTRMRLVEPAGVAPDTLSDRCGMTWVEGSDQSPRPIVLELDRPARIEAIHLVSPDGVGDDLPRDVHALGSLDGVAFEEMRASSTRVAAVWSAGPRAWVKGHGVHMEYRVSPCSIRYLRIAPRGGHAGGIDGAWRVAEVYLREQGEGAPPPRPSLADVGPMASNAVFVAADRWVSAHLNQPSSSASGTAFPRANDRYADTLPCRWLAPRVGLAIAVASPWAEETSRLLSDAAPDSLWERSDHGAYVVFRCASAKDANDAAEPPLYWQGSFLWRRRPGVTTAR